MNILVLGGIAESKRITQQLIERGHEVIYSIVGLVRQPDLRCELHIGGFSSRTRRVLRVLVATAWNTK